MAATAMVRTATPGIFKRGSRYVVVFRDTTGRQKKRSARTLAEARDVKASLRADIARGEYRAITKVTFQEYAETWVGTYQGRTSRGIRPETLAEYRRDLERDAVPWFGRMQLAAIEPRTIKAYAAHIAARGVAPGTVRLALAPVRVLLATAFEEGLIRTNPAAGVRVSQQQPVDGADGQQQAKALTETELAGLLDAVRCPTCRGLEDRGLARRDGCAGCERWEILVRFLAQTGLRISEALALRWSEIDMGRRRVLVRRRLRNGSLAPPKSRYGRRDVPLAPSLAQALWRLRGTAADDAPVFVSTRGGYLGAENVFGRVLKPAARAAGVPWAGLHTLRHTCATMLFRNGLNAKQVQVWLGHHSPAFTLTVYVHLLSDDLPEPAFFDEMATAGQPDAPKEAETKEAAGSAEVAV